MTSVYPSKKGIIAALLVFRVLGRLSSERSPDCATRNPGLTARLAPNFVSLNPGYACCFLHEISIRYVPAIAISLLTDLISQSTNPYG
jgi:hypothetical protein